MRRQRHLDLIMTHQFSRLLSIVAFAVCVSVSANAQAQQSITLTVDTDFTQNWNGAELKNHLSRLLTPCSVRETEGERDPSFAEYLRLIARSLSTSTYNKIAQDKDGENPGQYDVTIKPEAIGTQSLGAARGDFDVQITLDFRSYLTLTRKGDNPGRYRITLFEGGNKICAITPA